MKHIARLLMLSAASFLCVAGASADTIVSYGSSTAVNPAPSGAATASNTALSYLGYNAGNNVLSNGSAAATYNIGTGGGTWAGPYTGSSWVSFGNTAPGTGDYPNNGTYTYSTTISGVTAGETLTLSVYADDTTSVFLNGEAAGDQVVPAAPMTTAGKCTIGTPNCTEVATYVIDLTAGTDTLYFGVDQDYGNATGLDFAGTLNPAPPAATPEPSSLLLLGSGMLGAAGVLRRRFRA
jgi:hypothetical protein